MSRFSTLARNVHACDMRCANACDIRFLRARKFNGEFSSHDLDPARKYPWLTEGTPAHWLFAAAPHDPYGLAELVGGAEVLEGRLDEFFGLRCVARA